MTKVFSEYGDSAVPVSDRILDGFTGGTMRLALKNGTVIYYGFKFQEGALVQQANLKSVAIYEPEGRPRLLAAVDNVPILRKPFTSMAEYQRYLKDNHISPSVLVFVRNERDLDTYLPYLKRWLQADLLGFNVNCKEPGMAEACKFAGQIEIPTRAYLLPSLRPVVVPKVEAADVPLEAFTW
ncbi:MAG: hypothetical protein ACYC3A_03685 [Halothiobacillus sp.]